MPVDKNKTLWERLGGEENVTKVVDAWVTASADDPEVDYSRQNTFRPWTSVRVGNPLDATVAKTLAQTYCLLRDVEHRLQMENNLQTHTIPTSAPALGIHDALVNAIAFGLAIWAAKNLNRWFGR